MTRLDKFVLRTRNVATLVRLDGLSPKGIAVRLFITCWAIFAMHATTNIVREIYPTLAIGDHLSFRVDEYSGMHPDLFEKPGYGWHINANPGASMLAAVPYAILSPVVNRIQAEVNRRRKERGQIDPPPYNSPWPMARMFFQESWKRGIDIKLGLAAIITAFLAMAPLSALGVVAMFWFLRRVLNSDSAALWMSVLYAFGTPVFYRAAYLNHNMLIGHVAFLSFLTLWSPGNCFGWSRGTRLFMAGIAAGYCVVLDYSGVVLLGCLFLYAVFHRSEDSFSQPLIPKALTFGSGVAISVGLLLLYQWQSFGNPIFPAQRWMPRVAGSELGYNGMSFPLPDQLWANLLDYRYGLFVSCPILLLALGVLFVRRAWPSVGSRETLLFAAVPVGMWLFAGSVAYSRLQFNTGVRYMTAALPFLFALVVPVILRLPYRLAWWLGVLSVAQTWAMAMYRDVELGLGVLEPVTKTLTNGFTLPLLTLISRMGGQAVGIAGSASAIPLFLLTAALLYGLWSKRFEGNSPF
jgi:hypothetical protein